MSQKFFSVKSKWMLVLFSILGLTACQKVDQLLAGFPQIEQLLQSFGSKKAEPASTMAAQSKFIQYVKNKEKIKDAPDWINDIQMVLGELDLPKSNENMCSVIAVIEQESGFEEDPEVAGLASMMEKKIIELEKNVLVKVALELRLNKPMSPGVTFRDGLKKIKTENDLAKWYEAFTAAQLTGVALDFVGKGVDDIVSTVGSMQVSIDYARGFAKGSGRSAREMREKLYTRKGGVFYGTAHLLKYDANYPTVIYRFADYNSGQFSSRNAGFQKMVAKLTHSTLQADGDLSLPKTDERSPLSKTEEKVRTLFAQKAKNISPQSISQDLAMEKDASFDKTTTYMTVKQLFEKTGGKAIAQSIPSIQLESVKIKRKLTTDWYANSVHKRYTACMGALK